MSDFIRRLTLPVLAILIVVGFIYWWGRSNDENVSQARVLQWIEQGYPSQFCTSIYPKLQNCVTFAVAECEAIAKQQVQPCIDEIVQEMPQSMTRQQSQKYYKQASFCFERNMHQHLLDNYLVDSDECRQKMH